MASELQVNTITEATSGSGITFAKDIIPATPLSHRNMIINGAMKVAQRIGGVIGSSGAVTTSGYVTADRFRFVTSGGTIEKSIQDAGTSALPFTEAGLQRYARMKTTTGGSNAAADYALVQYKVEAQDINSQWTYHNNASSNVTLSFYARTNVAGTYYAQLQSIDGTSQTHTKSYTLAADTWKRVTLTFPGHANVAINDDNGEGLRINIPAYYGTNYTGHSEAVLDSWYNRTQTNGEYPNFAQNWQTSTNNVFDITGVQLELGTVATPFEHRTFAEELVRCRRYFIAMPYHSTSSAGGMRMYGTLVFNISPPMRTQPSVTTYGTGGHGGSNSGKYDQDGVGNVSTNTIIGYEYVAVTANSGNGYVAFRMDAEL